jgi:hypothetical protein
MVGCSRRRFGGLAAVGRASLQHGWQDSLRVSLKATIMRLSSVYVIHNIYNMLPSFH